MILKLTVVFFNTNNFLYKAKCQENNINGCFISKKGLIDGTHVQESIVQLKIIIHYSSPQQTAIVRPSWAFKNVFMVNRLMIK